MLIVFWKAVDSAETVYILKKLEKQILSLCFHRNCTNFTVHIRLHHKAMLLVKLTLKDSYLDAEHSKITAAI